MYILYLDESGDPSAGNDQTHFVLGGLAVHEGQIYHLSTGLESVQASFFPGIAPPIEFHTQHIREGKGRFRALQPEQRTQILSDISKIIANAHWPGLIAFATVVDVSAVETYTELRSRAFEDICQRFNTFLVREHKFGTTQKGLLVVDQSHSEKQYLALVADFRLKGTRYGYLGNIVDIPYFTESHNTRMMQLADFCAHVVYRYYEHDDRTYFDAMLPRFDRRVRQGPPVGLKHIIESGQRCECEACRWR